MHLAGSPAEQLTSHRRALAWLTAACGTWRRPPDGCPPGAAIPRPGRLVRQSISVPAWQCRVSVFTVIPTS